MKRKIVFSLSLLLFAAIVSMLASPIVDVHAAAPTITSMSITSTARHEGKSLYKAARQELHQDWEVMRTLYPNESNKSRADYEQGKLVTMTETSREPADLLVAPGYSNPSEGLLVRYYGLGETITFSIVFDQNVNVTGSPTLRFEMDGYGGEPDNEYEARYASGSGTDTLTFDYVVQAGDDVFGEIGTRAGLAHNTDSQIANASSEVFINTLHIREILAEGLGFNHIPDPYGRRNSANNIIGVPKKYPNPGLKHLVDTLSAHVRITGLIKSTTHTPEGYLGNLSNDLTGYRGVDDPSSDVSLYVDFSETPPMEAVTEPSTQTEAFDVEIRFFHYAGGDGDSVAADDPQGFEPADVSITGTGVNREDWNVELALIGLDHRDPGFAPSKNDKGQIKHTPAFIVYKATITPPNGFDGEVEISLEEGATADIVGNPSYASNTFTVPVRTPPTVQVARPEGETGLVTEGFTVEFTFSRNVVSPFDAEKISITQTDGTALAWNVAVTQPTSPSATVRAVVTPALNFSGEVRITLEAGAVRDAVAGSEQVNVAAGERLTVTVDTSPPQVIEAPKIVARPPEVYTGGDELTVEVPFDETGVSYEGDNPPYVVLYLGERVLANARHATWKKGAERAGSTIVPFVYPIRAGDVATSLSIDERGILIPAGTRVVDGDGNELLGQAPPAVAPTEPVTQLPAATGTDERLPFPPTMEEAALTFDISETPVVTYVPILEPTEEPRSPASDVPRSPIVFNELGNGSGDANDWLEFRNVTGAAVSLKEWELSVVQDGKQEDTSLIVFPDVSVPANGLLLLTNSDPTAAGNVLAGGDNVATSKVEQKGSPHRYLVAEGLSLPDDGQFLLILRKAKEKLGLDEAFVDVAGGGGSDTDAFIREQTGLYETYVWPLQVLASPGGDTEEALSSGKVWQRAKADIVGYHKDAWAEATFTGLGYDRKVAKSAATAGTPGYPNGALKPTASTPKGSVTFSEIMFDSAGGTLPQWIELYNTSKTEVLNLNRWKLEIQNVDSEDLVGRPIVTLTLQEKLIQPNQTLLIVAGNARASSGSSLPADRIYNLLKLHEKNLRIKKPQDTFLSEEGFYLKLSDSNGTKIDAVGNTDGNRRTTDAPAWALPVSGLEGMRSSLIRRYDKGVARAGMEKASWALAANFKRFKASGLHYGHADDIGTPGYRQGGALPVELSRFTVTRTEAGAVVVTWTTESEVDNAGFNLRRSLTRDSGFTLLNPVLIAGAGTTGERQTYTFTDTSAKPGVEYYYQIEEVAFDGKRETLATRMLRGPVSAANRALTTFGAVKQREE